MSKTQAQTRANTQQGHGHGHNKRDGFYDYYNNHIETSFAARTLGGSACRPRLWTDPYPAFDITPLSNTLQSARRLQVQGDQLEREPYQDPKIYHNTFRSLEPMSIHANRGNRSARHALRATTSEASFRKSDGEAIKAKVPPLGNLPFQAMFHKSTLVSSRRDALRNATLDSWALPGDAYYNGQDLRTDKQEPGIINRNRAPKPRIISSSQSLGALR